MNAPSGSRIDDDPHNDTHRQLVAQQSHDGDIHPPTMVAYDPMTGSVTEDKKP